MLRLSLARWRPRRAPVRALSGREQDKNNNIEKEKERGTEIDKEKENENKTGVNDQQKVQGEDDGLLSRFRRFRSEWREMQAAMQSPEDPPGSIPFIPISE